MNQITYRTARPLMRSGDIIAFGGNGFISEVIKYKTKCNVSHVGIILQSTVVDGVMINQIIESTSLNDGFAGVQINRMRLHMLKYNGEIWWLPLSDQARKRLNLNAYFNFLMDQTGKPYDAPQAIGSAIDILPEQKEDINKLFCSELVVSSLEMAGVLDEINASEQTPADVCRLNIYDEVYQLKGSPRKIFS